VNSRQNIAHHYDLSNELFALFLDPSLSYSAAMFDTEEIQRAGSSLLAPPQPGGDLAAAQARKTERLLDRTGVTAGTRLLEIGTGWGELAIRAARRGAVVHTITLSSEQKDLAEQRIAAAGLSDRVSVELLDYRALPSDATYDVVLSVEMIEAVGHEFWGDYFATLGRLTGPRGRIGLQAITMPHDRMIASLNTYTWIVKYIFPGGQLPSVASVRQSAQGAGLKVCSEFTFGLHYAETLRRWRSAFDAAADQVQQLPPDFDAVFGRMWSLYLAYSEAGFRSRYLDVVQFGLMRAAR
jgi:cyclopropane-fatty-acyl-phospholipid synthase